MKNKKIFLFAGTAILIAGLLFLWSKSNKPEINSEYVQETVEVRDIVKSLSGSGSLEPANSYTVMTLVEGDILYGPFDEGDKVKKDDVLYKIDDSDVASNVEKVEIALNQAKRSHENIVEMQYVESPISGKIHSLSVEVGDDVSQGEILAVIKDSNTMVLDVPFLLDDALSFSIGQDATITLDSTFEKIDGKITQISGTNVIGVGNMLTRMVTIEVNNVGGINEGRTATVQVGDIYCSGNGSFKYKKEANVINTLPGTIVELNFKEGDNISKNDVLLRIGGDDFDDQIQSSRDNVRNAEIMVESTQNQLDNYTVTSPINGTIVDKQYKVGDVVDVGKVLCTIYDLDYLEMVLNVDELDIVDISVGQIVEITADAIPDMKYTGEVTKVSVAGIVINGTTSYPVTIRIDNTDGLLPGMSVNSEIIIDTKEGVLSVPNEAIERDDKILVTSDSPSAVNALKDVEAPVGYVYVKIETGLSNDDYVEVISGLQEGDKIAYIPADGASDILSALMGGGHPGGMM